MKILFHSEPITPASKGGDSPRSNFNHIFIWQ